MEEIQEMKDASPPLAWTLNSSLEIKKAGFVFIGTDGKRNYVYERQKGERIKLFVGEENDD
jgi:hypothetical protein